jgi:hypothetical protein
MDQVFEATMDPFLFVLARGKAMDLYVILLLPTSTSPGLG